MNGKREGRGILKHSDGYSYDGEWVSNQPHGKGVQRW